jgi:hypothetical protein
VIFPLPPTHIARRGSSYFWYKHPHNFNILDYEVSRKIKSACYFFVYGVTFHRILIQVSPEVTKMAMKSFDHLATTTSLQPMDRDQRRAAVTAPPSLEPNKPCCIIKVVVVLRPQMTNASHRTMVFASNRNEKRACTRKM